MIFREARGYISIFFYFVSVPVVLKVSKVQTMCNTWLLQKLGIKLGTASKTYRHIKYGPNFNL